MAHANGPWFFRFTRRLGSYEKVSQNTLAVPLPSTQTFRSPPRSLLTEEWLSQAHLPRCLRIELRFPPNSQGLNVPGTVLTTAAFFFLVV